MRLTAIAAACLLAALLNLLFWWWPNRPQPLPEVWSGERFQSASFAPFRRDQDPLTARYPTPEQVAEDMAVTAKLVRGIRTYSALGGLQPAPALARRHGLTMMLGLWLSPTPEDNEREIAAAVADARAHPDVVKSVIVGNEVLLRRDLTAAQLAGYIRRVKQQVQQPVTYADVWEFWLQNPQLAQEVDFITVHFLPYWEDDPIDAAHAMEHVKVVYAKVKAAFPGKEVVIGEVGWPSRGRTREVAVPTRFQQALFLNAFVNLAEREGFSYNLIEAFDQPWKSGPEGTVGANWGLIDAARAPKFPLAGPVVEDAHWPWAALGATVLGLLASLWLARSSLSPGALFRGVLLAWFLAVLLAVSARWGLATWYDRKWLFWPFFPVLLQAVLAALLLRDHRRGQTPAWTGLSGLDSWRGGLMAVFAVLTLYETALLFLRFDLPEMKTFYESLPDPVKEAIWRGLNGRYRDFPLAEFVVPTLGVLAAGLAAGQGAVRPSTLRRLDLWYVGLLAVCLAGMCLVERFVNREAYAWAALALVPLALSLRAGLGARPSGKL